MNRILFILSIVISSQANSSTVSYMFSGAIDYAINTAILADRGITVSVGDSFSGIFSYDTDTSLQGPTGVSYRADYLGTSNSSITATIGGYAYRVENPLGYEMLVYNDDPNDGGSDHIGFSTSQPLVQPFSTEGGHIGINLYNTTGSALDSVLIPEILNFTDWSGSHMTIQGGQSGSYFSISGGIDSLSIITPVPLPPALYLFVTGLIGVIGMAKRKK